jgi:16S rRNA (cytidine1402-2'-O)-methyltransferase
VGTLYVIGTPAGDPADLTHRALRTLETVDLIVAGDEVSARALAAHQGLAAPVVLARDVTPDALAEGDVALLCSGLSPAPSYPGFQLIRGALDRHYPVVPIPGPSLAITALIISGLPADSFVYLGPLPQEQAARRELLARIRTELRSVVAFSPPALLPAALVDLFQMLGDRALAVVASSVRGAELVWRGRLVLAMAELGKDAAPGTCALVLGGAPDEAARWAEDRLCSEIRSRLVAGLGVKEISQQLAENSGWSRREIYSLSVELARQGRNQRGRTNAG